MSGDDGRSRRGLLRLAGVVGFSGLAGCESLNIPGGSRTSRPDSTGTTSTQTTTSSVTFDGGDLHSFLDAIERAASGGGGILELTNEEYRFDPITQPRGASRRHATIADLSEVTIEGNGARLVFTNPLYGGFTFERMQDLTVRNLTVDFDPLPFTQGQIISVSESDRAVTVRLDDGYPSLDHEMFQAETDLIWGMIHRPDGKFIRGYRGTVSLKFRTFIPEGARTYRVQLGARASMTGLQEGRRLTINSRDGKPAFQFFRVDQLTVRGVEIHAGHSGFATGLCSDPAFIDCSIGPPDDSNRHIGTKADGFRVSNCLSSTSIRNCTIRAIGDDGIVVQRTLSPVVDIIDRTTVDVSQWPLAAKPGDELDVLSRAGVQKGGLPPIDKMTTTGGETIIDPSTSRGVTPVTLTFAEPIDDRLAVGDMLGNPTAASQNFEVRNNRIRNLRGHCVRVATSDGIVEGNELEGATHNLIELECETWGEHFIPKGWVADVTIRNNRLSRSGLNWMAWDNPAAIYLHHRPEPDLEASGRPNENITIVGNRITNSASVGMDLSDARTITVEENELSGLNQLDYQHSGYGFRLSNVGDIDLVGNTVEGDSALIEEFGVQYNSDNVTHAANEMRIDGEIVPVDIRTWTPIRFEFNRTVMPAGGDLALAFRCTAVRLLDETDTVIVDIDVGTGQADDIMFGNGVFEPEQGPEGAFRWMGGDDRTATLSFSEEAVEAASTLEIEGIAYEPGISTDIYARGQQTDSIQFSAETIQAYRASLR